MAVANAVSNAGFRLVKKLITMGFFSLSNYLMFSLKIKRKVELCVSLKTKKCSILFLVFLKV